MESLKAYGVDTEKTFERFMGNTDLYEKFLKQFPDDPSFSDIKPAFDRGDYEGALSAAHTVKGVAANLGLDPLAGACSETVSLIRAKRNEEAKQSYGKIEKAYEDAMQLIGKAE